MVHEVAIAVATCPCSRNAKCITYCRSTIAEAACAVPSVDHPRCDRNRFGFGISNNFVRYRCRCYRGCGGNSHYTESCAIMCVFCFAISASIATVPMPSRCPMAPNKGAVWSVTSRWLEAAGHWAAAPIASAAIRLAVSRAILCVRCAIFATFATIPVIPRWTMHPIVAALQSVTMPHCNAMRNKTKRLIKQKPPGQ